MSRAVDLASSFSASVFVVLFTLGCASSVNHAWAAEPLSAGCNPVGGPCTSDNCYWNTDCDVQNDCSCYNVRDPLTGLPDCGCGPTSRKPPGDD